MNYELKITSDKIKKALDFAKKAHDGAIRKSTIKDMPYVYHPIEVATIVQQYYPENENAVIGALLHDTVEDTNVTLNDIKDMFGKEVANIVLEVTDDESGLQHLDGDDLKKARRQLQVDNLKNISFEAQIIRLGDKISNVSNLDTADKSYEWKNNYVIFIKDVYNELKEIVKSPMVEVLGNEINKFNKKHNPKKVIGLNCEPS